MSSTAVWGSRMSRPSRRVATTGSTGWLRRTCEWSSRTQCTRPRRWTVYGLPDPAVGSCRGTFRRRPVSHTELRRLSPSISGGGWPFCDSWQVSWQVILFAQFNQLTLNMFTWRCNYLKIYSIMYGPRHEAKWGNAQRKHNSIKDSIIYIYYTHLVNYTNLLNVAHVCLFVRFIVASQCSMVTVNWECRLPSPSPSPSLSSSFCVSAFAFACHSVTNKLYTVAETARCPSF